MASIRETVLEAFKATVQSITKANGYTDDIGLRVFDYVVLPQQVPTPAAIIAEGTEDVSETGIGRYTRTLNVSVGFVVAYSGGNPQQKARDVFADIQKACGSEYSITVPLLAGGTGSIRCEVVEGSNVHFYGSTQPGKVGGQIDFKVAYVTSRSDPRKH